MMEDARVVTVKLTETESYLMMAKSSQALVMALELIEKDPHQFDSSRPCDTCRTISNLAGRRFGCANQHG